jgi:hypothetical protein
LGTRHNRNQKNRKVWKHFYNIKIKIKSKIK